MGLFDGVPGLSQVEDAAGEVFDAGAGAATDLAEVAAGAATGLAAAADGAATGVAEIVDAAGDTVRFAEEFVDDPVGAVERALEDVSFGDLVDAVGLGLDDLAAKALTEAGLGPLVAGIEGLVDRIDDVVAAILRGLKCFHWLDVPVFWAVVGGLYGARVAELVSSKEQCTAWVERGELVAVVTDTQAVLSMLPCAIEAAFLAPLPSGGAAPLAGDVRARTADRLQHGRVGAAAATVGPEGLLAVALSPPPDVACVSRAPGKLDVALVRADGSVVSAAWEAGRDTAWRGWWPVANGRAHPGTPVTVVSRSTDKLDAFMVGLDGRVWTAAWQPGDDAWRGWWPIGDLKAAPGSAVGAVSRSTDRLDVVVVDAAGAVHAAAWEAGRDTAWRGWWPVADGRAHPGTPVTVVSRSTDKLDAFMVGLDGRVWTAAWQPGDDAWRGWWPIGDLKLPRRAVVHVATKQPDHLDVYARGFDGAAYTAAWEAGRDRAWRGWWRLT